MQLDFTYRSSRLRKELSDAKAMDRAYGDRARPLRLRLGVLAEASHLGDVPTGTPEHCHPLKHGSRKGQFAVTLRANWRLVFRPDHDPLPMLPSGTIDLTKVTVIELIEIVDYHEE